MQIEWSKVVTNAVFVFCVNEPVESCAHGWRMLAALLGVVIRRLAMPEFTLLAMGIKSGTYAGFMILEKHSASQMSGRRL